MVKLSVNETQWSSLLARTRALILYISIGIFDFGPEKLPGLSRNGPLVRYDLFTYWKFDVVFDLRLHDLQLLEPEFFHLSSSS